MYRCEIDRRHKIAIVLAIDQSGSMEQEVAANMTTVSKAEIVASVVGELIEELLLYSKCDNIYRDYYDIAVVGYSSSGIRSLISDKLEFVTISELAKRSVERVYINFKCKLCSGEVIVVPYGFPKWVEPMASGSTPMCEVLESVAELLEDWCAQPHHRECFPPIFVNISDGMPNGREAEQLIALSERIKGISTEDGNVLFVNINISSGGSGASFVYPSVDDIPRENNSAMLLAQMSSVLPKRLEYVVHRKRIVNSKPPYLALGYNISPMEFISMLNLGSQSDALQGEKEIYPYLNYL